MEETVIEELPGLAFQLISKTIALPAPTFSGRV
jgi:hypothetical protein